MPGPGAEEGILEPPEIEGEPESIIDPDWLDHVSEDCRIGWVRYAAWFIRTFRPVPVALLPLVDEANTYNEERARKEKEDGEPPEPWWWLYIPEEERDEALLDHLLDEWIEELEMSASNVHIDIKVQLHTHNNKTADGEPTWGSVDKTKLPRNAHAEMGEVDKKSTWKYPHHWIEGGSETDDDGVYTDGTMYLHKGGLNAAWSAANGARSGKEASDEVKAHLQKHRKALGLDDDKEEESSTSGTDAPLRMACGSLHLAADDGEERREYEAQYVKAGRIRAAGNRPGWFEVTPEAIQKGIAMGLFDNVPAFVDHAGLFQNPGLMDMAGLTLKGTWWNESEQTADGVIRLYPTEAGNATKLLFDTILSDGEKGEGMPDVGLSLVFWPERWEVTDDPDEPDKILEFRYVESIDFVFEPAAEGRIKRALSALSVQGASDMASPNDHNTQPSLGGGAPPREAPPVTTPPVMEAGERPEVALNVDNRINAWAEAMQQAAVPAILAGSGLPSASRERLAEGQYESPEALNAAVQAERDYLAQLSEDQVIQVGGTPPRDRHISLGRTGVEQIEAALDAMLSGTRPPDGIQPLTGIREMYHLLSGDYEMSGVFRGDRIYLANVNSSTMAGMVANAMNKRVVNQFQAFPQWWLPIVTIEDFNNLQDVRWITLGGVGELPTVAEGAAYTELTWDDQTETDSFVKKGGYLGITLEAIDKDDTRRLRSAPRALAQAAWLTLSKSVSAIFTTASGTGPTMSDSNVLFDSTNHGNLRTTALSFTEWTAVRNAMREQTEVHSGEILGALTAPKYLLVPSELEITALQVLASEGEPGTADNETNPFAEGNQHDERLRSARRRVIVVDLWTSATNWAAVADPMLYPSIGLGFRYGRTPEIFSVASPTAGLMFSNDTMPVKVRFFYAVGPTDWRGLHKNNV